jgi:regulator of RNase E activity RraA
MDASIKACLPIKKPLIGFAVTATFRSGSPPVNGLDVYSGLLKQIEAFKSTPAPPVIVFQDLDEPNVAATVGEVMCTVYQAFGASGLITSGTVRDVDQVEAIGFPMFAKGINPSHAWCHIVDVNVPVTVGGLIVRPGDLLHGDHNGVTSIPIEIAASVARACKGFLQTEEVLFKYLRSPNPTLEGLKVANGKSKELLAELMQKIKSKEL